MTALPDRRAIEIVERDVRELLASREIAIDHDPGLTRLVDEVIDDYRARYLSGGLPPLTESQLADLERVEGGAQR